NIFSRKLFVVMQVIQNDKSINTLPLNRVRIANYGRLYGVTMHIDGILHLGCTDTMAGYIEHIIYATRNFIIAFFVSQTAVSCKILSFIGREISQPEALVVDPCGAKHTRTGKPNTKHATDPIALDLFPFFIHEHRLYTG